MAGEQEAGWKRAEKYVACPLGCGGPLKAGHRYARFSCENCGITIRLDIHNLCQAIAQKTGMVLRFDSPKPVMMDGL